MTLAPLAAAAPAEAGNVKSGNNNQLVFGGQVSRAVLFADDGRQDRLFHVDNENDSTRVFWNAEGALNEQVTFGADLTFDARSNPSNEVTLDDANDGAGGAGGSGVGANTFTQRVLEFYIDHAHLGRLSVGQGSTASDDRTEVDLSETAIIGYSQVSDMAGGIKFRAADGSFGPAIGDSADNLDGNDRDDRIRYDSPEFAGLSFGASHASNNSWDVGFGYAGEFSGIAVEAGLGIWNQAGASEEVESGVSGSISVLHASGLNVTFAAGDRDNKGANRSDSTYLYGKLGYIASLFSHGPTAFSVDYGNYDDISTDDDEANSIGVQAVQRFEEIGSQAYIGYRYHELDRTGTNFDDIHAVMTGVFFQF